MTRLQRIATSQLWFDLWLLFTGVMLAHALYRDLWLFAALHGALAVVWLWLSSSNARLAREEAVLQERLRTLERLAWWLE